jgi:hypothetical protein
MNSGKSLEVSEKDPDARSHSGGQEWGGGLVGCRVSAGLRIGKAIILSTTSLLMSLFKLGDRIYKQVLRVYKSLQCSHLMTAMDLDAFFFFFAKY